MDAGIGDDGLVRFEAHGAGPLPAADIEDWLDRDGARIWHASYGDGPPVVLLHGGPGHAGNWGYQVPAILPAGYRVIVIDSRGHGRSTRGERPYSYERMASGVLAVMDALGIDSARLVGWSDGACIALVLAARAPARAAGVFFFAGNMDPGGTKVVEPIVAAVGEMMRTQPDYTPGDLAAIGVPVAIVQGEHDEFIRPEHAAYPARTIPGGTLMILPGVSHFAPLQRPARFNAALLAFLDGLPATLYLPPEDHKTLRVTASARFSSRLKAG